MAKDPYEKENCTGCVFFTDGGECVDICHNITMCTDKNWPDRADRCDEFFKPSIECRKVNALEMMADNFRRCLREESDGFASFGVDTD